MHDSDGNGWLGNGRLGDGRLGNGRRKDLVMDSLTAMQRQWSNPTEMDSLTATAMNGLAMNGLAMNSAMAQQWTAWQQCDGDGRRDGNKTLMEVRR